MAAPLVTWGLLLSGLTAVVAGAPTVAPRAAGAPVPVQVKTCSLADMIDGLRQALRHGSPALRRYARELLKESSIAIDPDALRTALMRENDPQLVEALGAALAARTARTRELALIKPQLDRAVQDSDPAVRAAAVRSLRGIGSVEAMREARGPGYERLIVDPAPEVRKAVVENLLEESAKVYFGHDQAVSQKAVQVAAASPDPALAARLLREISTEQVDHGTVQELTRMLTAGAPEVRAAAALALGGVSSAESAAARAALLACYDKDGDAVVRRAVLEALAHLGMSSALPLLESLRGVDAAMGTEIDLWRAALQSGLQEWTLIQRERQHLAAAR